MLFISRIPNITKGNNTIFQIILGLVVQSIVSLTSSLEVKLLTVLVSTISNPQVFLLKKKCVQKLLTFFQQKYYRICHT